MIFLVAFKMHLEFISFYFILRLKNMPTDNGYSFGTLREPDAFKPKEKRYSAKDK
jgi:hypothetical protein